MRISEVDKDGRLVVLMSMDKYIIARRAINGEQQEEDRE